MHILDFSYDDLLEIVKRVRVADIHSWIQTCKAFASLRNPHLALPLQLLRVATEHDLGPDILELPAGATAVELIVTRPQRLQNLLLHEALNGQSLVCYHTTIRDEKIIEAKIVPGGRWLVTITDQVGLGAGPNQPMMCRVWDLNLAEEESDLKPCATLSLSNRNSHNSGQLGLRRSTEGNTAQIWVFADGLRVIELDHNDRERPLRLLRIITIEGMDTSEGIGWHGDYVFNVVGWTITLLNWVTGCKQTFEFEAPALVESNFHVLSIGPEGLVVLDQIDDTISFYAMPDSRLGAQDRSEPAQESAKTLNILRRSKRITIQGIVPYDLDPHHWPPVNRPYSARQPATAVIRFPEHLVYVQYPSNPREADLDRLPLTFDLPPGSSEPAAYRRTTDGNVVGVGVRGFGVHFLMKDGSQSVQTFEQEFGDNFTRKFVCPFGGIIGGFGTSHRVDKIYLWKVDGSS
ncbi:hypothetical protein FRC00_000806 [Tulasnella sp. 408]|nr:hypothetical protein FRC00_000806 [Tulasnella sp. 408]